MISVSLLGFVSKQAKYINKILLKYKHLSPIYYTTSREDTSEEVFPGDFI